MLLSGLLLYVAYELYIFSLLTHDVKKEDVKSVDSILSEIEEKEDSKSLLEIYPDIPHETLISNNERSTHILLNYKEEKKGNQTTYSYDVKYK